MVDLSTFKQIAFVVQLLGTIWSVAQGNWELVVVSALVLLFVLAGLLSWCCSPNKPTTLAVLSPGTSLGGGGGQHHHIQEQPHPVAGFVFWLCQLFFEFLKFFIFFSLCYWLLTGELPHYIVIARLWARLRTAAHPGTMGGASAAEKASKACWGWWCS
jgi:hypothetical protein